MRITPILLCVLSLGLPVQAQEVFTLSPDRFAELQDIVATIDPVPDWNCLDVALEETPLRAIMPNDDAGNPARATRMLQFLQDLVPETVLASTAAIGTALQDGSLDGIECDLFASNPAPAPGASMGIWGVVVGPAGQAVGTVHCYGAADYAARTAQLAAFAGGPLEARRLWLGRVLYAGSGGSRSLRLAGQRNFVLGDAKTHGVLRIEGSQQTAPDTLNFTVTAVVSGTGHTIANTSGESVGTLPAVAQGPSFFVAHAVTTGTSFTGSVSIVDDGSGGLATSSGQAIPDGAVVYATGDITVDGAGLTGRATFVSEGSVVFASDACALDCAVEGLLAHATVDVRVEGSFHSLLGACYAGDRLVISGDANTLHGRGIGHAIEITGDDNVVNDGAR